MKRSKKVLFLFDGVRVGSVAGLVVESVEFGTAILGSSGDTDMDLFAIGASRDVWGVGLEGMRLLLLLLVVADDELGEEDDDGRGVDDEAK